MPELDEPRLRVRVAGGEYFEDIKSYDLQSSYMTPTDQWSFVAYSEDNAIELRRLFRPMQPIDLYIDNALQVQGRIDSIESSGTSGKELQVTGRDYLADIVDSNVDPTVAVTDGMDIAEAVLQAVRPFGIETILGDGNLTRNVRTGAQPFVGPPPRDIRGVQLREFRPQIGQGVFEYCEKIVAHQGFTLQPAERGSIVIALPLFGQEPLFDLTRTESGERTNALKAVARRDYTSIPTVAIATGRGGNPGAGLTKERGEIAPFGDNAPSRFFATNPEVTSYTKDPQSGLPTIVEKRTKGSLSGEFANGYPLYRPLYYQDKDARNNEQLERGLKRRLGEFLQESLVYTATIRGHRAPGTDAFCAVDVVAAIRDEVEDVLENMWCRSRRFYNSGSGPMTDLEFIRLDSITL